MERGGKRGDLWNDLVERPVLGAGHGAVFGTSAVYFPQSANMPFAGATFNAPAGVNAVYITGLMPNVGYGVSVQANGAGNVVNVITSGANATTDAAGVLAVAF